MIHLITIILTIILSRNVQHLRPIGHYIQRCRFRVSHAIATVTTPNLQLSMLCHRRHVILYHIILHHVLHNVLHHLLHHTHIVIRFLFIFIFKMFYYLMTPNGRRPWGVINISQ